MLVSQLPIKQGQINGQPAERQNSFQICYSLGQYGLGLGAGRGDLAQDMAQRMQEHQAQAQEAAEGPLRQYGFGLGFGRPRAQTRVRTGTSSVHDDLDRITQRLQREINDLTLATNELHNVRLLEAEMSRLRRLRATVSETGSTFGAPAQPAPPLAGPILPETRVTERLHGSSQASVLTASSEALPDGLTLPQGWTMMPLQRLPAVGQPIAPPMSMSASAPAIPTPTIQVAAQPGVMQQSSSSSATMNRPNVSPTTDTGSVEPGIGNSGHNTASLFENTPWQGNGPMGNHLDHRPSPQPSTRDEELNPVSQIAREMASIARLQEPSIAIPTLPTWGSSTPLAAPVSSSPATVPNGNISTLHQPSQSSDARPDGDIDIQVANGTEPDRSATIVEPSESASVTEEDSSKDKGKAKAATVEESIEDGD